MSWRWIGDQYLAAPPDVDPTPFPHTCGPARVAVCRACDADQREAEDDTWEYRTEGGAA
jgi:hypothetical protein